MWNGDFLSDDDDADYAVDDDSNNDNKEDNHKEDHKDYHKNNHKDKNIRFFWIRGICATIRTPQEVEWSPVCGIV